MSLALVCAFIRVCRLFGGMLLCWLLLARLLVRCLLFALLVLVVLLALVCSFWTFLPGIIFRILRATVLRATVLRGRVLCARVLCSIIGAAGGMWTSLLRGRATSASAPAFVALFLISHYR